MMRGNAFALAILSSCALVVSLSAQQTAPETPSVNSRNKSVSSSTADQQKNDRTDVSITRDIRRALVKDKTLSTAAHNIKVITQHGDVTLKGPVRTEEEKTVVEAKATEIAGAGHVNSELSVAASKRKS